MNILIAGGAGTFLNNILIKCHKEGHKVSVLTGNRFANKSDYQKCFEFYNFPYDANCLNDIFESASPDVTIFMGAFDTNFKWENEEADSVKYTGSLANILMGYAMRGKGRFIYFSSDEVYGDNHSENISEETPAQPSGFRAQAIYQGESLAESYRINRDMDVLTVRFDHLYCIPDKRSDVLDLVTKMCLEALEDKTIHYTKNSSLSPLYEKDAIEALHKLLITQSHNKNIYQISAESFITEEELANTVRDYMNPECAVISIPGEEGRKCVLSGRSFDLEFGNPSFNPVANIIKKIAITMKRNSYVFLTGEDVKLPLIQKFKEKAGWFIRVIIPFVENLIVFIPCFMFYNRAVDSKYFARLDIYLLYVLLFAIIYGQQQATVSALLAVAGYFFRQSYDRSSFDILIDGNTYVWVAQLFIVGLTVGYMRDQIYKLKKEGEEEKEYLEQQIDDIESINSTNVRVKNVLENQVVNQTDSVGKIYGLTSSLDQYSPEEVLFFAAETVGKIMKSQDVAIYTISNADYARLFSATSNKARCLGSSVKYSAMEDFYEEIARGKVYINRKMDARFPLMANAIFENGEMKMIIMVWGLSWENMTLGQANQLVVVSSLIQNAVLRSNRFMDALVDKRYLQGTSMLAPDSFKTLLEAFVKAEKKGLTVCTVIKILAEGKDMGEVINMVQSGLRQSDYFGSLDGSTIYTLLANTSKSDAAYVVNRFKQKGLDASITEELGL